MAFSLFLNIILFILLLYINYLSYIKCLSFYQQEHYHLSGFSRYLKKIYLKQWWIHLSLLFIFFHSFLYITLFFCIYFLVLILLNYRERKKIIVHFKITKRMMRFSICYITLFIFILILSYLLNHSFSTFNIASLIIYYFNPLVIFLISLIMMPIEKLIMKKYLIKSKNIIKEYKPIIIAITGSGGKTSIKHMIFDMMKSHEEVYASPKSYNTLNGLCKTINDIYSNPRQKNLKLILEMGASHVHDIEKITKNIIPDYAILSNILPQHLSSFHSMENIIHEKMQIIVRMKDNGICIVNFDNKLIRDNILSFIPKTCKAIISYTTSLEIYHDIINLSNNLKSIKLFYIYGKNIKISIDKTIFEVEYNINNKNGTFPIYTSLLGKHTVSNILSSISLLLSLDYDPITIQNEIQCLNPYPHRLEKRIIPNKNGFLTILDDAYNSNIAGFLNALEVLSTSTNNKFVITPGIVDGGNKEKEINTKVASAMIDIVDQVILVKNKITKYYIDYFMENHFSHFTIVSSFKEAYSLIKNENITVLIENDLTDNYFV